MHSPPQSFHKTRKGKERNEFSLSVKSQEPLWRSVQSGRFLAIQSFGNDVSCLVSHLKPLLTSARAPVPQTMMSSSVGACDHL